MRRSEYLSFELKQIWYHIEDSISPSEVKMIRQVMDIYASEDAVDVEFRDMEIFGLQIIARNLNQELGFIHEGTKVKVNVSNNLNWPTEIQSTLHTHEPPRNHVKLEIKYFTSIKFKRSKVTWSNLIFTLKTRGSWYAYTGIVGTTESSEINWIIRPEFSIKLPLGLKMLENHELNMIFERFYPAGLYGKEPYIEQFELNLKKPDVTRVNGKRFYTFVIDDKDYNNIILKTPENCQVRFSGEYTVVYENRFIWIPIFGFLLVPFIAIVILQSTGSSAGDIPQATVAVAVLSYFILLLTLKREEYELPLELPIKVVSSIILVIFVVWILILIKIDIPL